jgi:hypothetical protein
MLSKLERTVEVEDILGNNDAGIGLHPIVPLANERQIDQLEGDFGQLHLQQMIMDTSRAGGQLASVDHLPDLRGALE